MVKYLDKSAKTPEEAISLALSELGLERDDVTVEIIERPKSGFLGIGATPAVVRIGYEANEDEAVAPKREPAAAAPAAEIKSGDVNAATVDAGTAAAKIADEVQAADTVCPYDGDEFKTRVYEFVNGLLTRMGVSAEIEIADAATGGVLVTLSGKGMGAVIGRRGETLDAIQHLTNFVINRGGDKRQRISIDAEQYRAKREESLVSLAEKMAAKVIKYKRSMALEPMNSYERHVIHTALQSYAGVSTASTGVEPNRRVVVTYEAASLNEKKPQSREWS